MHIRALQKKANIVAGFDLYVFREKRWVCEEKRRPQEPGNGLKAAAVLPRPMEVQAEVEWSLDRHPEIVLTKQLHKANGF